VRLKLVEGARSALHDRALGTGHGRDVLLPRPQHGGQLDPGLASSHRMAVLNGSVRFERRQRMTRGWSAPKVSGEISGDNSATCARPPTLGATALRLLRFMYIR
jgi:hypothetical protein